MSIAFRACVLVIAIALVGGVPRRAEASAGQEVERLRRELQAKLAEVEKQTLPLMFCKNAQQPCPIRLWVEQEFISKLITLVLANRQVTFSYTGTVNGPFADGGDCLGCGWYADIDAFGAQLAIHQASPNWITSNPSMPILTVRPAITFAAQVQVRGVIKGPAGPCDWQIWKTSCSCPIGGGFGTSIGASASLSDTVEFRTMFRVAGSGLRVGVSLPSEKTLRATARVGLGQFGTATFPLDLKIPAGDLFVMPSMPLAFGTSGQVDLAGTPTKYTFALTNPALLAENSGLALRWQAIITFQP